MLVQINNVSWACGLGTGAYKNLVDELFVYGAPESAINALESMGPRLIIAKGEQAGGGASGEAIVTLGTRPKNLPPGNPGMYWNSSGRFRAAFPLYYEEFNTLWEVLTNPALVRFRTMRIETGDGELRQGATQTVVGLAVTS